jgi:aspartate/tyrosine/aromatic aminotransferase
VRNSVLVYNLRIFTPILGALAQLVERNNGIVEVNGSTPLRSKYLFKNTPGTHAMPSFFSSLKQLPDDPIFGLQVEFNQDPRKNKINLSIGAYQNDDGHWEVFTAVREAEKILLDKNLDKEYQGIEGHPAFIKETLRLIFGEVPENSFGAQTIGGTCALRLGGDFLAQNLTKTILVSNPTWPNHARIFNHAGMTVEEYPYYDTKNHALNFEAMCDKIKSTPAGCAILLHGCCHNPSGIDPTQEQWKELSLLIKKHNLFPFFDLAYQGFGFGIEEDAFPIRQFAQDGHEMLVAYSYSKNFGLYGERIGLLAAVTQNKEEALKVGSIFKTIIRGSYSNPPLQGARIIATVLQSTELKKIWKEELTQIRMRTQMMRQKLLEGLNDSNGSFDFLKKQKGMFSYSGLNAEQVGSLQKEYGIYMLKSGRINVTGLNEKNINSVINSISEVTKK